MPTEFCQKCKQSHPGRTCDYDEKGECSETTSADKVAAASRTASKDKRKKRMRVEGGNSHSQTEFSKRCLSFKFLDQLLLTGDYTNYSEMCRRSHERNGDVYAHNGPYRRFLPAFRDVRGIVRQLRRA